MTNRFSNLEKILITLIFIGGSLILFIPIQYLLVGLVVMAVLFYLLANPKICFYLVIFTIPFVERIRILPISFSINDILILVCLSAVILNIIIKDKKVSLTTNIDIWNIVLLILFFIAGLTSEGPTGPLTSFKFLEAIIMFYLTVFFIRTKHIKISQMIKVIFITILFQALLGTFQSLTGVGAIFRSPRGIWGYLGLGSNMVWHGVGTMVHFNMLGNLLVTMFLFALPVCKYLIKNKTAVKLILGTIFIGIITTYSRGSLIALYFGYFYFLFITMQNKVKLSWVFVSSLVIIFIMKNFLSQTSYVSTISPRTTIWNSVIASILSCPRYTWFGAGLNSYEQVVNPYLPQDETMWFAHDFFLLTAQEMGIIGFIIFFSFIIFILIDTYKRVKTGSKLLRTLNLSITLCIFSIFFVSIFDHAYSLTTFKILLFIMLGIIYAKNKKLYKSGF
ncbi:MAG: O-antigen ligase family protein [Candidatus Gastranaerophilales bacterium]|nr:O-antigen ligase family protein [Candidatus Gastranaerophilales bacterium]